MRKLLHIIATPRGEDSRTLKVSSAFLETFREENTGWMVEELDLFREELPELTVKRVDGKYLLLGGKDLAGEFAEAWQAIVTHIERFLSADAYLVSVPMWNFSIPYPLKQYIDIIVQPKYLFQYTPDGVEGLAKGRKMTVITSRGGDYSTPETSGMDRQEPYLRQIFAFVGITDITFINTQPMDAAGPEVRKQKIEEAQAVAREEARAFCAVEAGR